MNRIGWKRAVDLLRLPIFPDGAQPPARTVATSIPDYEAKADAYYQRLQEGNHMELNALERAICRDQGFSQDQFLARKRERTGAAPAAFSVETATRRVFDPIGEYLVSHDRGLLRSAQRSVQATITALGERYATGTEREVARQSGISLGRLVAARQAHGSGRRMIAASDYEKSMDAMRRKTVEEHVRDAIVALEAFARDPQHVESLKYLLSADAELDQAIKKTPAVTQQVIGISGW
jgi:hypothetical protein